MSHGIFTTVLIQPIYNAFIFLISIMPGHSAGVAIILLTLFIRLIFYPTFSQAMKTQWGMRRIEGEMEAIKEKYKDNAQLRGEKTMALMKANNVRPFASFLALFIQLPVFIALYIVFNREGFPKIVQDLVYSFTPQPDSVGIIFLGVLDLTHAHNIILALLVAGAQFVQSKISQGNAPIAPNIKPEKAQMMEMQKKMLLYFLPLLMASVAYSLPAAAGLYLLTNAFASLVQDVIVRRKLEKNATAVVAV